MSSGYVPAYGQAPPSSSSRNRASSVPRNDLSYRPNYEQYAAPIITNDESQRYPVLRKYAKKSELTPAEQYKREVLFRDGANQDRPIPPPKPSSAPVQNAHNAERISRPRQRRMPDIVQPATFTEPPSSARLRRETSVHATQPTKPPKHPSASQDPAVQRPREGHNTKPKHLIEYGYNTSYDSLQQGAGVTRYKTAPAGGGLKPASAGGYVQRRATTSGGGPTYGFPSMGHSAAGHKRGHSDVPHQTSAAAIFGSTQESPTSSYTSTTQTSGTSHYATSQTVPPQRIHKRQSSLTRSIMALRPRPRANSDSQGVRPAHVGLPGLTPTTTRTKFGTLSTSGTEKSKDGDGSSSVFTRVRKISTGSLRAVLPCLVPDTVEDARWDEPKTPFMTEWGSRLVKKGLPSPPGSAMSHESRSVKRDRRLSPGGVAEDNVLHQWQDHGIDLPPRRKPKPIEIQKDVEVRRDFAPARPMPFFSRD